MRKFLFIIAAATFLTGCESSYNLRSSVYIYDDEFTDLPAYTEWGYNTFGAYYDRSVFISDEDTPATVLCHDNKTAFTLDGELRENFGDEMSVTFILTCFEPGKYSDLVILNDSTIDLADESCKVCLFYHGVEDTLNIIDGELYFKRVQHLLVDKKSVEAILSGYFQFKTLIDGKPITLSNGRFDVGLGYENFYSY